MARWHANEMCEDRLGQLLVEERGCHWVQGRETLQKLLFEAELVRLVGSGSERLDTEGLHFLGSRLSA